MFLQKNSNGFKGRLIKMKEIKPCPFCGGEGELIIESGWSIWVSCKSCGAEGAWVDTNEDDAIDKWNMRV